MKAQHTRLVLLLLASALCTLGVSSCNTFRGFGRDVERTGQHIERATR